MLPHIPIHGFWWLAAGGASYGARYATHRIRMARSRLRASRQPDPTEDLLRLQSLYGYNAHSLVSIAPGARAWTIPGVDGAIVYGEFSRVLLAAGDPLTGPDDIEILTRSFLKFARDSRRIAAFVPVTEQFAKLAPKLGLSSIKIGAAPYFDLKTWHPRGNPAKKLRAGVNQ